MRHPWLILAAIVVATDVAPEMILARRLEQEAIFAQRMGRMQIARQELWMAEQLRNNHSETVTEQKGKDNEHH